MEESWLDIFSTWTLIRASGLLAYFYLFLAITGGILARLPFIKGIFKATLMFTHQSAAKIAILVSLFHANLLACDTYIQYRWTEIFIPFVAQHKSFLSGLGTITFYLLVTILLSIAWMKQIGRKLWRILHFLSFPAFLFASIHGIFLGTDSNENIAFYTAALTLFLVAVLLRMAVKPATNSRPNQAEHTS